MSFGQLAPKLSKLVAGVVGAGVGSAVTAYNYKRPEIAFLSTRQWDYWQRSTNITTYSHTDDGQTKSTISNSYTNSVNRGSIVAGVVGSAVAVMVYNWYLPTGPGLDKIVTGVVGAGAAIAVYDYFIYPRSHDGQTKSTNNGD